MPKDKQRIDRNRNLNRNKTIFFNNIFRVSKRKNTMSQQKTSNPETDNTKPTRVWKYGAVHEWVGVGVNFVVAAFTIFLFYQTKKATNAAVSSAQSAQRAVSQQIKNDSIAHVNDSLKSIIDSINNEKRLEHDNIVLMEQRRSIDAQIGLIKENKKEFDIQNRPIIQVTNISFDTIIGNEKRAKVSFHLVNIGRFPAKISEGIFYMVYGNKSDVDKLETVDINKTYPIKIYKEIISPQTFLTLSLSDKGIMSDELATRIVNGDRFVFLCGKFKYKNFLSTGDYEFDFAYQIGFDNKQYTSITLKNDTKFIW